MDLAVTEYLRRRQTMTDEAMSWIKQISSWDSGGGIELDIVELADGKVLAISEEAVVLYDNMDDLESGEGKERPTLYL